LNTILASLGAKSVDFMGSSAAFWVLVFTYLWKNSGYDMILWLAGLDGISVNLYEAARVDGANSWQCFRYITLPGLLPTVGLVSILSMLNGFKVFREAYLVAGAYPHDSIYLLQHLFNNWFQSLDISRLCAAAVLLCIVLLIIILLMQRFLRPAD
jgi:multiple sugar transport system permease protein